MGDDSDNDMQYSDTELEKFIKENDEEMELRKKIILQLEKKKQELKEAKKQEMKLIAEIRKLRKQVKEMVVGVLNTWQNLLYLHDSILAVNHFFLELWYLWYLW